MEKLNLFNYQSYYGQNSNYEFEENEGTQYLKTSEGKTLPFQLFTNGNRSDRQSNILREDNSKGYSSDFALIERQFSENKSLSFTAGTKVRNAADVAWLFRALEDEAVEHTFALYRFKDDSYLVQHLSSGGITSAVVDLRLLAGNAFRLKPESITLVHNHPSGHLVSSRQDRLMLEKLNKIFENTGIKVEDGIILNLRSGKYLSFSYEDHMDTIQNHKEQAQDQKPVNVYSFNKQVFVSNYQPYQIKGPEDIAAYLSAQKFGLSDKTEALILNNANEIVGKFVLPQHKQLEKLTELLTIYAGTSVVLFGNNVNEEMYNSYKKQLEYSGFTALDAIRMKSGNYYSISQDVSINPTERNIERFSPTGQSSSQMVSEHNKKYQTNLYTQKEINVNNKNTKQMSTEKTFNQEEYLKNQLKYLGFGEGEKLHKDLEKGIKSKDRQFEIKTSSDKALPGNKADFTLKFGKTESGGVFLNSYQAKLTNAKGEELSHNFPVNRENTFTAKEAINLLEGRSVKIEFHNPKSDQKETAFVKLNFEEPKTEKGNYQFQNFYQNYGVDTAKIVEKSNLIFDKPEYKDNTIKSLEKGNVVKVKFEMNDKVVEGKAVLNPQYKNLNLYDSDMNRINTNKALEGMEQEQKNEKANAREQSIKR